MTKNAKRRFTQKIHTEGWTSKIKLGIKIENTDGTCKWNVNTEKEDRKYN